MVGGWFLLKKKKKGGVFEEEAGGCTGAVRMSAGKGGVFNRLFRGRAYQKLHLENRFFSA